jgi:GNAT superfamily N-acetyltransferase
MTIQLATTDNQILACFPVMRELRPQLSSETFLARVRLQMKEGYRLVSAADEAGTPRAVAGFRILHTLFAERMLYVDDLVSAEAVRGRGFGHRLVEWLIDRAREEGCDEVELDSGTHRHQAHGFYFREGFVISSFHFRKPLGGGRME